MIFEKGAREYCSKINATEEIKNSLIQQAMTVDNWNNGGKEEAKTNV